MFLGLTKSDAVAQVSSDALANEKRVECYDQTLAAWLRERILHRRRRPLVIVVSFAETTTLKDLPLIALPSTWGQILDDGSTTGYAFPHPSSLHHPLARNRCPLLCRLASTLPYPVESACAGQPSMCSTRRQPRKMTGKAQRTPPKLFVTPR